MRHRFFNSKSFIFLSLILGLLLMSSALFSGDILNKNVLAEGCPICQNHPEDKILTKVTGRGNIEAKPDMATLSLAVDTKGDTADEASKKNTDSMLKIKEALQKEGVQEEDIVTSRFSLYPLTHWNQEEDREEIDGFSCTNEISIKTKDLENVGHLLSVALEAGATSVNNIYYDIKDTTALYKKALSLAMKEAKEKADVILESMDKEGKMVLSNVEENYAPDYTGSYRQFNTEMSRDMAKGAGAAGGAPVPISYDNVTVTANITATFQFVEN